MSCVSKDETVETTVIRELPDHKAMFVRFLSDSGDDAAARTRFQRLITDLVMVRMPDASEVAYPGGGDWGIDTYVGSLDGDLTVWQSKFFTTWGKTQRQQIRESFKQVMTKASEQGFTVAAWTLCAPSIFPPDEQKWFDGWKQRESRRTGVRIDSWNGAQIRFALQQPDARYLRDLYFPESIPVGNDVPVAPLVNPSVLSDSLFVTQLETAGYSENDAAKSFFFAAEAMARDVAAHGVPAQVNALFEAELEVHGIWEHSYNTKSRSASKDGRIVGIVEDVNSGAANMANTAELRLRPAHRRGLVHRLVETARAGWVTNWRDIAAEYRGTSAIAALEQSGDLPGPSQPTNDSERGAPIA